MRKDCLALWLAGATGLIAGGVAEASLVDLGEGSFSPLAETITFDELGVVNPVYEFTDMTDLTPTGHLTVSFGGYFLGQSNVGSSTGPDTLIDTTPVGPLSLDPDAPATFITDDTASGDSPVLSGSPRFNGPIAVLFSAPVAGVGLSGGYFDAIGGTTIEAYDVFGNSLGSITNSSLGQEFYGLADDSGKNMIAGISFYITGEEPAGFAIDNLTFGSGEMVVYPDDDPVPLPPTIILFGSGCAGLLILVRRKRG